MSDHHLIQAVERGELTMAEAFAIIKQGDDAHQAGDHGCDSPNDVGGAEADQ